MSLVIGKEYEGNWKEIDGFPNYVICDDGRVVSRRIGEERATNLNQAGIRIVTLMRDGARITKSVALMVATAFLDHGDFPPEIFDTPIHLNGNKGDCRVENLAWRPRWFAVSYHKQFTRGYEHTRVLLSKPIMIVQTEEVFERSWDAAVKYGLINMDIVKALQNEERCFPFGFTFELVRDPLEVEYGI